MKILFLTESLGLRSGGIAVATLHLAITLANQYKSDSHVIIAQRQYHEDEIENDFEIPNNLKIVRLPKFGLRLYPLTWNLLGYIEEHKPDLLYLKGLWRQTSWTAYRWKKKNKNKLLMISPAGMLEPRARKVKKIYKDFSFFFIEKRLIESCDAVHAISVIENRTLQGLDLKIKNLIHIPEGIPTNDLIIENKEKAHNKPIKKLLFISRLDPIKGLDILIESLSIVDMNGWECEIIGSGSNEYRNKLNDQIKYYKLQSKVFIKNACYGKNKERVFREASAFILPSYSEGFGIAIAEAMRWALPVITTTSTPWDVIKNRGLGWYVKPNVDELSNAISELFNTSPEDLRSIGKRCREHILQRNDWNDIAEQMKIRLDKL
tara:strand:- start:2010 stop:3140 length:1131 start_codon:yes stop_codon:yes gene_type:complete